MEPVAFPGSVSFEYDALVTRFPLLIHTIIALRHVSDRMGYLFRKSLVPEALTNATEDISGLRAKILNDTRVFPTLDNYWDAASGITLLQEAYQVGQ